MWHNLVLDFIFNRTFLNTPAGSVWCPVLQRLRLYGLFDFGSPSPRLLYVCLREWCFHDLCGGFHFISLPLAFLFFSAFVKSFIDAASDWLCQEPRSPFGACSVYKNTHDFCFDWPPAPFCPFPLSISVFFLHFFGARNPACSCMSTHNYFNTLFFP